MKTKMVLLAIILIIPLLGACSPTPPKAVDTVIVDTLETFQDGAGKTWKVEPGTYKLEMTATNDGASVDFVGGNCQGTGETKSYTQICEYTKTGQIEIMNPTTFGLGAASNVTIKITKLAR